VFVFAFDYVGFAWSFRFFFPQQWRMISDYEGSSAC